MRPHLLHPLADRRHARRHGRARRAQGQVARSAQETAAARQGDTATQRVRDAGGPIDRASYTCECGLLFQARVSTTVMCPHCGAGQAW
ncbi:MAG: hypothetical protein E6G62_09595 [Actinobacteria bacterium]|nr:MAG: hypothetical protein E6G62_09595 [Actinomycetota bacterium]